MTRQYRLNIHLSQRENNDDSQTTRDFEPALVRTALLDAVKSWIRASSGAIPSCSWCIWAVG